MWATLSKSSSKSKNLVRDDPNYYKRVCKIDEVSIKALKLVEHCMDLAEEGKMAEALMAAARAKPAFNKLKTEVFDDLRSLMTEQEKIIADSPVAQAHGREQEKQLLLIGVGANILIAIALSMFLVRGITRRLDIMVANTVLLVRNEKLFPPMPGTDEIARLDQSFHEMVRSLKELEEIKQQFVSMVSHDLRTPLTSVRLFLELLEEGAYGELTEAGAHKTKIAERSVTRLIALINDLLDFERLQAGQLHLSKSNIDLDNVITRSIDAVQGFAEQHKVRLVCDSSNITVQADGDRLIQVLVNLISNAVKFSPENSTVTVSAKQSENGVEIRVADQGRGIPKNLQSAIFDRFKQVKKTDATEKGGTGLGLAICKAIVECHEGKIGVDSEEGRGATFWFSIPTTPRIASKPSASANK